MKDVYTMITNRIIDELESGAVPWHKPWIGGQPAVSHTTGKAYSLLNQLLLGGRGGEYVTFQQAVKEGGCVKKDQKASIQKFAAESGAQNPAFAAIFVNSIQPPL